MSAFLTLYRVQDDEGRGPFRPGFSRHWFEGRDDYPPSFVEWFGDVRKHMLPGEHVGCGCRTLAHLDRWFRDSELRTLRDFGYRVVKIDADRIIGENVNEVIFARRRPLRFGAVESEAHHESYAQEDWLTVVWLCRTHHKRRHRKVA